HRRSEPFPSVFARAAGALGARLRLLVRAGITRPRSDAVNRVVGKVVRVVRNGATLPQVARDEENSAWKMASARLQSSAVVFHPSDKRKPERASSRASPIAERTCEGSSAPLAQAEPAL